MNDEVTTSAVGENPVAVVDPRASIDNRTLALCYEYGFEDDQLKQINAICKAYDVTPAQVLRSFENGVVMSRMEEYYQLHALAPRFKPEHFMRITSMGLARHGLRLGEIISEYHISPESALILCSEYRDLEKVERVLIIRRDLFPNMTITLASSFFSEIDFQLEDPEVILNAFAGAAEYAETQFPWHRFRHIIDNQFGGDILKAYQFADEEPEAFCSMCFPGAQSRHEGGQR